MGGIPVGGGAGIWGAPRGLGGEEFWGDPGVFGGGPGIWEATRVLGGTLAFWGAPRSLQGAGI